MYADGSGLFVFGAFLTSDFQSVDCCLNCYKRLLEFYRILVYINIKKVEKMQQKDRAVLHTIHRLFHRKTAKIPSNRQATGEMSVKKSFFDRILKIGIWFTEQHSENHLRRKNSLLIFVTRGTLRTQTGTVLQIIM